MKKKKIIPIIAIFVFVILLITLFIPVPQGYYDDGGTREYKALTYKIVDWNRIYAGGIYENTRIYFGSDRNKSIDELWELEDVEYPKFVATVLEINGDIVLVEPIGDSLAILSCDRISFSVKRLDKLDIEIGSVIEVTYMGGITETYPATLTPVEWKLSNDSRYIEYTDQWLDKEVAEEYDVTAIPRKLQITQIYSNCFFARPVKSSSYEIKINDVILDDWCVGDQITCAYESAYYDKENARMEVELLYEEPELPQDADPNICYKPVIYLYPEEKTNVSVDIILDGQLTCTYPTYNNGWSVTASPDGTLIDSNGQIYNYLYWEGKTNAKYDLSKGFCVKGEDTATFLEDVLNKLGLNRREANEFIVYWLPLMENNPYNIISFQTDKYTDAAQLEINPSPDTIIRVFMTWQESDSFVNIPKQELSAPERTGFTVVEWGGTKIK